LNDEAAASGTSSTNGCLRFNQLPASLTNILELHSLAVWDSASNSLISTSLP
jgi:hypothetical protein